MLLIIDNYDSFVYNLLRYCSELGQECQIHRNDELMCEDIISLNPQAIILSPGPCSPLEAGICLDVVRKLGKKFPILGVCLGRQTIGSAFGAKITKAKFPLHGEASRITHDESRLFKDIPRHFNAGRYHSLIVDDIAENTDLQVTAWDEEGQIMALQHKFFPLFGVQFHPESLLTEYGHKLLQNFLDESLKITAF